VSTRAELFEVIKRLERERNELLRAARAVLARWDSPSWKDTAPTAEVMGELRKEVARYQRSIGGES
jgi:hypothetical protein